MEVQYRELDMWEGREMDRLRDRGRDIPVLFWLASSG
jgi:hypothetical protein